MSKNCSHLMLPIHNWYGRYRCKWCKSIGYRKAVTLDPDSAYTKGGSHIILYTCQDKKCNEYAQVSSKKFGRLCFYHHEKKKEEYENRN